jgi:diguanylate cyclase (GGDEF)-like protein
MPITLDAILSSPRLPSPPAVAIRLVETTRDPRHSLGDVVKIIRSDPALSAKIIRAANSALYGLHTHVSTLDHAAALLGTTTVTALALSFTLIRETSKDGASDLLNRFWATCLIQAVAAEMAGSRGTRGGDGELFLAGLLADLGQLALLQAVGGPYLAVLAKAEGDFSRQCEMEQQALGLDHVTLGARLAESWNLPPALCQAIGRHHSPAGELAAAEPSSRVVRCVALACRVAHLLTQSGVTDQTELQQFANAALGMSAVEVAELVSEVQQRVHQASEVLQLETPLTPDPAQLFADANAQLAQLTVQSRQEAIEQARSLESRNVELQSRIERDTLTGLFNRAALELRIKQAAERAMGEHQNLGVIFGDIDKFKVINDTYGHAFGDRVLVHTSRALEMSLRGGDFVARYGGEEFAIVIVNTTAPALEEIARRLVAQVEALRLTYNGQRVPVTISIGGLLVTPADLKRTPIESLLEAADQAMYCSKRAGGNRYTTSRLSKEGRLLAPLVSPAVDAPPLPIEMLSRV